MSTEELLRPRYKVKIEAPGCPFKPGDVIEKHKYASGNWYIPNYMYDPEDFPDVFKKLEWMDERPIEDMPIYVKHRSNVYQVDRWSGSFQNKCWVGCYLKGDGVNFIYSHELTPATLAEYEQYINQQKQTNGQADTGTNKG